MGNLSFWTTGEEMTETILNLVKGGSFYKAIEILKEGGADNSTVLDFMMGKKHLVGDTRKEGLSIEDCEPITDSLNDPLFLGWCTFCKSFEDVKGRTRPFDIYNFDYILKFSEDSKHLKSLLSIISLEFIKAKYALEILKVENFSVYKITEPTPTQKIRDGVILEDGTFVEVAYQYHRELYPILSKLGLSDNEFEDDWASDETKCIRISDFRVSGMVASSIERKMYREIYKDVTPTDLQLRALSKWKFHFNKLFNDPDGTVMNAIRKYTIEKENKGAKWGNLIYLSKYTDLKIPTISFDKMDDEYVLRTSPKKSMAGVLESMFGVTKENHSEKVNDINIIWEKYKDLVKGNELHIFSQSYLKGLNGVCNFKGGNVFDYSVSSNIGDVVKGVKNNNTISREHYMYLKEVCRNLHKDLGQQIQLEFVIADDGVYIVQLRTIDVSINEDINIPEGALEGFSFTSGKGEFDLEDTLIVEDHCESKDLIGKKCLIVRDKVDFSHVLVLSQTLKIPSIYGVGNVVIPDKFEIDTMNRKGYILSV